MNRLDELLTSTELNSSISSTYESVNGLLADDFASDGYESAPACSEVATFAPMHYESGYAYPLVVWLHDAGQSEHDLPEVMAHVSTRNYVAAAPKSIGSAASPWRQSSSQEDLDATEQAIFDAIETARERFSVHSDRVFLVGAGAGGAAALRVALAYPEQFAGVASFDGPAPIGNAPLRRINAVRGLPIMLTTGSESERYPAAQVCRDMRLLYSAGCVMHVRQEPGDGDLTVGMLTELDQWMMQLVCCEASTSR